LQEREMTITIKAAAHLRLQMPAQQAEVRLEGAPAGDVTAAIARLGIPLEKIGFARVNGQTASLDHALRDGDCVELFPRIGGG